jgi:hypothetical protein
MRARSSLDDDRDDDRLDAAESSPRGRQPPEPRIRVGQDGHQERRWQDEADTGRRRDLGPGRLVLKGDDGRGEPKSGAYKIRAQPKERLVDLVRLVRSQPVPREVPLRSR